MAGPGRTALLHTAMIIVIWAVALPGALIIDEVGWRSPPWRPWGIGVAVVLVVVGASVSFRAGRHLAGAGAGLFGVRPGARLVTDGPYRSVRNPQDVGATLVALGTPFAVGLSILWIVPVIGVVYFVLGVEPLEDRHLLEAFGDEFRDYRVRVPKWLPIS